MTEKSKLDHQLELARSAMQRNEVALSVLAKGDASPFMTPELKQKLEIAREKMKGYARQT